MLPLLFLLINDNKLTLQNLSIFRNIFCPPVHWIISKGGSTNHNSRCASARGKKNRQKKTNFLRLSFKVRYWFSAISLLIKPLWWDILTSVIHPIYRNTQSRVNYVVEILIYVLEVGTIRAAACCSVSRISWDTRPGPAEINSDNTVITVSVSLFSE